MAMNVVMIYSLNGIIILKMMAPAKMFKAHLATSLFVLNAEMVFVVREKMDAIVLKIVKNLNVKKPEKYLIIQLLGMIWVFNAAKG